MKRRSRTRKKIKANRPDVPKPRIPSGNDKWRESYTLLHRVAVLRTRREERERLEREQIAREKMTDEEWDEWKRKKIIEQAKRAWTQVLDGSDIEKKGQSDYYSGIEYFNLNISNISENFHSLRRENGRFGSYPDEDSYNECSQA